VTIGDYVIVGGLAAIHQFVRVGESAILSGGAMVVHDVPPFCNASGDRARLRGLNLIGLKRRGFDAGRIRAISGPIVCCSHPPCPSPRRGRAPPPSWPAAPTWS